MKTIQLPLTKQINLRTHKWIQHCTNDEFEEDEIVTVEDVGKCRVKIVAMGMIELYRVEEEE